MQKTTQKQKPVTEKKKNKIVEVCGYYINLDKICLINPITDQGHGVKSYEVIGDNGDFRLKLYEHPKDDPDSFPREKLVKLWREAVE